MLFGIGWRCRIELAGGPGRGLARLLLLAVMAAACADGAPARPGDAPGSTPTLAAEPTAAGVYGPGWAAVHADARNSDYSATETRADLALAWETRIEGSVQVGPLPWTINLGPTVGQEGNLYVTSTEAGCHLRALDATTGALRWCAPALDMAAVVSSPAIDREGVLYLADGQGLHAFDADGRERWVLPLRGVPLSVQFTPDGRLVFVTNIGVVYLVERATGELAAEPIELAPGLTWNPADGLWACARGLPGCPAANTIAVDPERGTLFFTFWEPGAPAAGVRAMRYRGGPTPRLEPLWTNDALPGGSASSPTLSADGRRVYLTDNAGTLHALDAATGTIAWSVAIGYAADGSASVSPEGLVIPAGGRNGTVVAVRDLGDRGEVAWRRDDLPNRGIVMQAAGGRAYVTACGAEHRCELVVLDTRDGSTLDREAIPGQAVFSVGTTADAEGRVFVAGITGRVVAFR